jgi:hypothetical protein
MMGSVSEISNSDVQVEYHEQVNVRKAALQVQVLTKVELGIMLRVI